MNNEKEITIDTFLSFKEYHSEIFECFIETTDVKYLIEFESYFFLFDDFRKHLKDDVLAQLTIEEYLLDIKRVITRARFYYIENGAFDYQTEKEVETLIKKIYKQ